MCPVSLAFFFTLPEDRQGLVSYLQDGRHAVLFCLCKILYPAGAAAGYCFLLVSSFFFFFFFFILPAQPQDLVSYSFLSSFFFLLLSSGNTRFSHISLHPILTKLGHNDRYLDHYSGTKDGGVRGHHGVTGVKKVICTKKASSPSDYVALTRDLCICSSLTPSTKVMVLKNCQGSFGVTGVKSSFSQKGIKSFRLCSIDPRLMHMQ